MIKPLQFAKPEDVPELVKLINSAYRGPVSRQGWTHESDLITGDERINETGLAAALANRANAMLMIKEQEQIKGCVMLEKKDEHIYLGMLSVNPAIQTKGIGKKLMQQAEQYALQNGFRKILMTVISARKELIEWYNRRGYSSTGETLPFPPHTLFGVPKMPLEFVVLEKHL